MSGLKYQYKTQPQLSPEYGSNCISLLNQKTTIKLYSSSHYLITYFSSKIWDMCILAENISTIWTRSVPKVSSSAKSPVVVGLKDNET